MLGCPMTVVRRLLYFGQLLSESLRTLVVLSLSHREREAEGQVRDFQAMQIPHPAR
jgi:hypothetical protein